MDWKDFEIFSKNIMEDYFGATLTQRNPHGFPKKFDMVSSDDSIIGDSKYLTLVNGVKLPPAKFMEISGHVWLLEKLSAKRKFLVFGNQKRVPEWWLEKYGHLVKDVEFYFIDEKGNLEKLN